MDELRKFAVFTFLNARQRRPSTTRTLRLSTQSDHLNSLGTLLASVLAALPAFLAGSDLHLFDSKSDRL